MSDNDSADAILCRGRDYAAALEQCGIRDDAAVLYADALRTYGLSGVDWKQVNGVILDRWSASSLNWIKTRAWKLAKEPK